MVRRLQEYERYRKAAEDLDRLPRLGRDVHVAVAQFDSRPLPRAQPKVALVELLGAFKRVLERAELYQHHHVLRERLSVRERMTQILSRIDSENFVNFEDLFNVQEGRLGIVVTFIAVLEMLKEALLVVVQAEPFAPIYVKAAA